MARLIYAIVPGFRWAVTIQPYSIGRGGFTLNLTEVMLGLEFMLTHCFFITDMDVAAFSYAIYTVTTFEV